LADEALPLQGERYITMLNLSNYLKKLEKFLPYEVQVRNAVIQAIQEVVGITLERSQIRVSRGLVVIQVSAAVKSEIALKQIKLLACIKKIIPHITLTRIS